MRRLLQEHIENYQSKRSDWYKRFGSLGSATKSPSLGDKHSRSERKSVPKPQSEIKDKATLVSPEDNSKPAAPTLDRRLLVSVVNDLTDDVAARILRLKRLQPDETLSRSNGLLKDFDAEIGWSRL